MSYFIIKTIFYNRYKLHPSKMKTNCIYHSSQLITNFCRDKHCLMPLCPQCISQHSQYHEDQRTRPQYTTLHQILADVHVQIGNCIQLLSQDKARNGAIIVNIQTVGDLVKQKIATLKEMIYNALQQSFLLLQKDVNKMLDKMHEEKGVYLIDKSQKQDKLLLQHLDQLQALKNTLKGQRGLSNIIYFMREKQAQIDNFHTQFSSYLHANQSYQPKVEINSQSLYSLDAVISRALKVGDKNIGSKKKPLQTTPFEQIRNRNNRATPVKTSEAKNYPTNNALSTANRLRQRGYAPFVESQIRNYSPHISRERFIRENAERGSRVDGQYQNLSKKVAMIRQQNERLSRVLTKN